MHGRPVAQDLGEARASHPQRWRILAVLVLALVVTSIDHTVINVALPRLVEDLGATAAQLQWIVAAYTIVFAGLLLTAGSLGDRFGRRRALLAGLATFLAGSMLAALAPSTTVLIAARGVMGVGRRADHADDAVDHRQRLRSPGRAGQGDRGVDRGRRRRHRPRPDRRRLPDAQLLLVVGLLDQRAPARRRAPRRAARRARLP